MRLSPPFPPRPRLLFDMIDVVLCELEGVVAETAEPRRRAMVHAFAEDGLDASRIGEQSPMPVRAAIERALDAIQAPRDATLVDLLALRSSRHFAAEVATGLTLAPGALQSLASLQASARLGLVTRAEREVAEQILALAGLEGAFEVIVTAGDVIDPKPSPEAYRMAHARLTRRRPLRGALAIEDGMDGVRSAHAAGVPCILASLSPAHDALEADAVIPGLAGHTLDSLSSLVTRGGARVA